ncbi:phosphodiester glycosidase family protein [Sorangium sp. So ce131]|uniref:phosphodiester glycosidase family protein n=1 Tax=Sorangium sp. So ce131 TaxID=3133282 RepID=UPI003F5E22F2
MTVRAPSKALWLTAGLALVGVAALASRYLAPPSSPAPPEPSPPAAAASSAPFPAEPSPPAPAAPSAALAAPSAPAGPPSGAPVRPEVMTVSGEDYVVHVFAFRLAAVRFEVVDAGMSRDLAGVLDRTRASIVINGGFFDRHARPEGLVVAGGRELSPLAPSLGGGVLVVSGGRAALHDAAGFVLGPGVELAVQARPRLVVRGERNVRSDGGPRAERTALCALDQGRRMEVIVARGEAAGSGPTLGLLADMLVARGCEQALNLDGGPSTGVAWREDGSAREMAPRGPIRHAIAVRLDP